MFSADSVHGTISKRNPRRRQRTTSEESMLLRQTSKRRKRSSLTMDTFEPDNKNGANGNAKGTNGNVHQEHAQESRSQENIKIDTTSLAIRHRGTKRGDRDKRTARVQDGIVQTKNENYSVVQDPNLPDAIRGILSSEPWRAEFSNSLGFAVALTHTQAIIWRYASKSPTSDSFKALVIKLPFPPTQKTTPTTSLPLGKLVHDSGAGELALLVAMPSTGKIVYWESVTNAANNDVSRQKQQGLLGAVGSMLSGEEIIGITDAEPDGFTLSSSTGRVSHLTVRDSQGRPLISTQAMRGNAGSTVGFLGGIKNVFSSAGWKREIAAVRAIPSRSKGHYQCIVVTIQGSIQVWDMPRHSPKTVVSELEAKDGIFSCILRLREPELINDQISDFSILDFVVVPIARPKESSQHRLLMLAAVNFPAQKRVEYYLVDVTIQNDSMDINVVHPVSCFHRGEWDSSNWKAFRPHLLLPEPAKSAFVVFDQQVVIVSLAVIEESPSSQLQMESHLLSDSFQDVLYLKQDTRYHVVGCSTEIPDRDPDNSGTIVILVHGFGLVRVSASSAKENQSTSERAFVTLRSKMEQAIFFGNMKHNLLDFRFSRAENTWSSEEVEAAALVINESIMNCTSQYFAQLSPSMETQLRTRAGALADLITFLTSYNLKLTTRWQLLWSAEKMAAARAIWKTYESVLATKTPKDKALLVELLDMLSEQHKHENQPQLGETDIVRHYLIHDISRIQLVIPWAQKVLEELYMEGVRDIVQQARFCSQANDIVTCAMEAAFTFREANAELYGIGKDVIDDGIYQGDYHGLPEIWTSIPHTVHHVKKLTDFAREMARSQSDGPEEEEGGLDLILLRKLAEDNPALVHICCQVYEERSRWLKCQTDPTSKSELETITANFGRVRNELIVKLADIELAEEGIKLAERYRDMKSLVDVLVRSTERAQERIDQPGLSDSEEEELMSLVDTNRDRIQNYYNTFGTKWATALYTKLIDSGQSAEILDNVGNNQTYLNRYLRDRPKCAKISWINEVTANKDYCRAAQDLMSAQSSETELWSKKIELSMAKLALLAGKEKDPTQNEEITRNLQNTENSMFTVTVQEHLYNFLHPTVVSAIDATAQVDLAMGAFGRYVRGKPALTSILKENLSKVLAHKVLDTESLIDTLTLINESNQSADEAALGDRRFFLALKVLDVLEIGEQHAEGKALLEKLIWRRCLIQDNWTAINRTELKNDAAVATETAATSLFRTLKAGFQDGFFDNAILPLPSSLQDLAPTPSSLRSIRRFAKTPESTLEILSRDLESEDRALKDALKGGRLDMWWKGVLEAAQASVRTDADEAGVKMARRAEAVKVLSEKLGLGDRGRGWVANGNGNGNAHSEVERDDQGDVVMH